MSVSPGAARAQLEFRTLRVADRERSYAAAVGSPPAGALLLVFHGSGIGAAVMAAWTGLATRGPEAGFTTIFPEAVDGVWDDSGLGRKDGADDAAFVASLVDAEGHGEGGALVLAGLSNGATFVESLARHGTVAPLGIVLVAGTARAISRRRAPRPVRPCGLMCVAGTADPSAPYRGGRATGLSGWIARRRVRRHLAHAEGRESLGAESLAAEWAMANGCGDVPVIDAVGRDAGDLPVDRLSWSCPGGPPVVLYRITGGGHGWPGGPQYMPKFVVGRISRRFDATAATLDFARALVRRTA